MVKDLKSLLKNKFDQERGLAIKVAEKVGYKNPTPLYKFVDCTEREIKDFRILLDIVQMVFPKEYKKVMKNYIMSVHPNSIIARCSLEYSLVIRDYELFDYMIEKLECTDNKESQEWAKIYKIDRLIKLKMIDPMTAINNLQSESDKLKSNEMKFFCRMLQFYYYYQLRMINVLSQLMSLTEGILENIKDEYMFNSYFSRLNLIKVDVAIHSGQTEEAMKYGEIVINSTKQELIKCLVHLQLGNANIIHSYERAMEHYNNSMEYAKQINLSDYNSVLVHRGINFVSSYWGKHTEYLDTNSNDPSDVHEVAFHYIKNNQIEKGLELLDSLDFENLNSYQRAFNCFYRGLAHNSLNFFYESIKYFNKIEEKYYKKLPIIELRKLGEKEYVLEALSV
jgi:hypothetical protein